jgi:hypothetical protein
MSDDLDLTLLGESGQQAVTLPKAVLVNKTSGAAKAGGTIGKIYIAETGENLESITVVPITFINGRMWFQGNGSKNFCRSDDGKFPIKNEHPSFTKQANDCSVCLLSKWKGRYNPPKCNKFVDIVFANLDPKSLCPVFTMSFQRHAYKDVFMALSTMSDEGGASHNKLTINAQLFVGKMFEFYIPTFTDIKELTDEEEALVAPIRVQYLKTEPIIPDATPCTLSEIDLED